MVRSVAGIAVCLAALLALGAPARADEGAPADGRFVFRDVADGVLRLDTRTGQVSHCDRGGAGWSCRIVPDERAAIEAEIARLQDENRALKKELAGRGAPRLPEVELKLPSDADVDRVMTFMEKVWRRLIEMVQRIQKETERKG